MIFEEWCSERDYKEGTFGKFIKNIKALMNAGLELEHHTNHAHQKKRIQSLSLKG